ncbi:MAG: protocatechuate 3,4-dioxygenase [SAR324 cluster bacterium]|nr:protocatechuate 3,4-dioxygenase [SAR324 cluster bacterium]
MKRSKTLSRRQLVRGTLAALPLLAIPPLVWGKKSGPSCLLTPSQGEGPFYPLRFTPHGMDLTRKQPGGPKAQGRQIVVRGTVTDARCRPLPGAEVQIWQADSQGRYNHPHDPRNLGLDSNFLYWGRVLTDAQGRYAFRTIAPAAYPASSSWMRPPHIHFKVRQKGAGTLVTQMYFPGNALNASDYLLGGIEPSLRQRLIAKLAGGSRGAPTPDIPRYLFDISMT